MDENDACPLVRKIAPRFADLVEATLRKQGDHDLAGQIASLRVFELCGCGDKFCSSFYVRPREIHNEGDNLETVDASIPGVMVLLDLADRDIRFVEVLDDGEIRARLDQYLVRGP